MWSTNKVVVICLLFGCTECLRNHKDETPSTKFARLLPRFWNGNERIY